MALVIPKDLPVKGFYRHYKHDPSKGITDHVYLLLGVGFDTEEDGVCRANYIPIYEDAPVYQASLKLGIMCIDNRPLSMWMEEVPKGENGEMIPRFTLVTDKDEIDIFRELEVAMYKQFDV